MGWAVIRATEMERNRNPTAGLASYLAGMEIIISSRHTDVSPAVERTVHDKIGRLQRFDHEVRRARVHFNHEATARLADRETCEVLLEANGERFVSRVAGPDQFTAIDLAVAKLEHQLSRSRLRRTGRSRAV